MEHIIKQLKRGAKDMRLSPVEKAAIKSQLLYYAKMHPPRVSSLTPRSTPSPFFSINNFRNKKSISVLVIGGLLMGSSVSFAAEGSVPGDTLYPVKVHVNENVRGAVAVTPKAKAEWEVRLVERRLEEVEKLATMPGVLSKVREAAQENLLTYTRKVEEHIARFEDDDDRENALATAELLSKSLHAHESTLLNIATTTTANAVADVSIAAQSDLMSLRGILNELHDVRGEAEEKHDALKKKYHREGGNDEEHNGDVSGSMLESSAQVSLSVINATTSTTVVSRDVSQSGDDDNRDIMRSIKNTKKTGLNHDRREEISATPDASISATVAPETTATGAASEVNTKPAEEPKIETHKDLSKDHDNE